MTVQPLRGEELREKVARIIDPRDAIWEGFAADALACSRALAKADAVLTLLLPAVQPPEGFVLVPQSALDWLNGQHDDGFERPEGMKGNFWWRTEFRRRAGLASAAKPARKVGDQATFDGTLWECTDVHPDGSASWQRATISTHQAGEK